MTTTVTELHTELSLFPPPLGAWATLNPKQSVFTLLQGYTLPQEQAMAL